MSIRVLQGFLVALAIGGGVGALIAPLADAFVPSRVAINRVVEALPGQVQITVANGRVQAMDQRSEWFDVHEGDRVSRPARIRTLGEDGEVSLKFSGVRVVATSEAEFFVSAKGPEPSLLLRKGHMRFHRATKEMTVFVPDREVKLVGQTLGVWARDKEVVVSVLDGELDLHAPGRRPIRFARGREIRINSRRVMPSVLSQNLQIQVQGTSRRPYKFTLTARTAPHALVVHTNDDGDEKVIDVSPAGVFSVDLVDRRPAAGTLVAYDSAGRRAEIGVPSVSLDDVVEKLTGTAVVANDAAGDAVEPVQAPKAKVVDGSSEDARSAFLPAGAKSLQPAKSEPVEVKEVSTPKRKIKAEVKTKPAISGRGTSTPQPVRLEIDTPTPKSAVKSVKVAEKPEVDLGKPPKSAPQRRAVEPPARPKVAAPPKVPAPAAEDPDEEAL